MTVGGSVLRLRLVTMRGVSLVRIAPPGGKATPDSVPRSGGRLTSTKISKKLRAGKSGPGTPLGALPCTIPRLRGATPAKVPALTIGQLIGTFGTRGSGFAHC